MRLIKHISTIILIFLVFSITIFLMYCTEPVAPEFPPPTIQNDGQIKTIGKAVEGSSFSMFISVAGSVPFTFKWLKDGSPISGELRVQINDTLNINPLSVAYNGSYQCIVTNSTGADSSKIYSLTVATPPVIDSQPKPQSVIEGQATIFSVCASGTKPLSFQWQKDSIDIPDATDSDYIIDTTEMADSGCLFMCIVSNLAGADTSIGVSLSVNKKTIVPSISSHPQSQSVLKGQSVTFSVLASGTKPLVYQWQKESVNIAGATDSAYTIDTTKMADSGCVFRCIVSNLVGADTSKGAILQVSQGTVSPTITTQPQLQSIIEGQAATFLVSATGTPPLSYQWQKESTDIPGATDSSYTTPATTLADSGSLYRCIVSNTAGADTSNPALLKVMKDVTTPTITAQPQEQSVLEGQTATFAVQASGTAPLNYQWQKNGADISGATDTTYITPATTYSDSGSLFRCIVSNSIGADTSNDALLQVTVNAVKPEITGNPENKVIDEGDSAIFSVTANGTAPLSYQWQKNEMDITNATAYEYIVGNATMADNNTRYRCIVSNTVGSDTSSEATLTVNDINYPPKIEIIGYTNGQAINVNENETLSFTVSISDTDGNQVTRLSTVNSPEAGSGGMLTYDTTNGSFSYTPDNSVSNQTTNTEFRDVTFTAQDNGSPQLSSTFILHITVINVNRKPVFETDKPEPLYEIDEGQLLEILFGATDLDGENLLFEWGSTNLPHQTDVVFDTSACKFSWQSATTDKGNYSIIFSVRDGIDTTTTNVNVRVGDAGFPPAVLDIPDATVNEGESFTVVNLDDYVTDADHNISLLSWAYSGNIELSVSIVNRVATITIPDADWNGAELITFTATDPDTLSNSDGATFTVNGINDEPSFTKGSNEAVNEDCGVQSVNNWATSIRPGPPNENSQTVSFTVTNNNNALFSAQPAISSNGTLTYTSATNANGSATVTVKLKDDGGTANGGIDSSAAQKFTITISAVNDAPVWETVPDISHAYNKTFTISLSNYVSDPEGSTITYGNTENDPDEVGDVTFGAFTGNCQIFGQKSGSFTMTYSASDGDLTSWSRTVTITIINSPPVWQTIPTITGSGSFEFEAADYVSDADPDDILEYSCEFDNNGHSGNFVEKFSAATGHIVFWGGEGGNDGYIRFSASDGENLVWSSWVTVSFQ